MVSGRLRRRNGKGGGLNCGELRERDFGCEGKSERERKLRAILSELKVFGVAEQC